MIVASTLSQGTKLGQVKNVTLTDADWPVNDITGGVASNAFTKENPFLKLENSYKQTNANDVTWMKWKTTETKKSRGDRRRAALQLSWKKHQKLYYFQKKILMQQPCSFTWTSGYIWNQDWETQDNKFFQQPNSDGSETKHPEEKKSHRFQISWVKSADGRKKHLYTRQLLLPFYKYQKSYYRWSHNFSYLRLWKKHEVRRRKHWCWSC